MKIKYLLLATIVFITFSCTENQRARKWGGKSDITIPKNTTLLNITWKESSLWLVYRDNTTGLIHCKEKSPYGIVEGEVVIKNEE